MLLYQHRNTLTIVIYCSICGLNLPLDPVPNSFSGVEALVGNAHTGQILHPLEVFDYIMRILGLADLWDPQVVNEFSFGL